MGADGQKAFMTGKTINATLRHYSEKKRFHRPLQTSSSSPGLLGEEIEFLDGGIIFNHLAEGEISVVHL